MPFENSCTGAITAVYDLLLKYGFYIVGEEYIKINQNLVGIKGAKVEDIKEIYSKKYASDMVSFKDEIGEDGFICSNKLSFNDSMEIFVQGNEDRILLMSRYDNLGKGASGAAIQNMNILLGTDEKTGLEV